MFCRPDLPVAAMNDWYDAEQRVEKARRLFEQRQWALCLEELRAALSLQPYNSAYLFNIGLTLDELGEFDQAIDAYRQSLEIKADDIDALNHLGVDLSRVGRHDEALTTFAAIEHIDAQYEPSYCNRIIIYTELGRHEQAEEMFYTARLYKDDCPHCYYNIGLSLMQRGLFDKAIYCWQKALDLDEHRPQVHRRMAQAYWGKRELEKARQHYVQEMRSQPGDTQTLLELGKLLLEMGRHEEAGEKFRRAIEQAPEQPGGYYCHGRWLIEAGHDADAVAAFVRVLQLDPTFPGAHLQLGRIYLQHHDPDAARRHLRSEHLLRGDDPRILLELSDLLLDAGEGPMAIAALKRLTELSPGAANAFAHLAVAHFLSGDYAPGIAASRRALDLEPADLTAMHNLAVACERLQQYDAALQWVRTALLLEPANTSFQRMEWRLRFLKLRWRAGSFLGRIFARRPSI